MMSEGAEDMHEEHDACQARWRTGLSSSPRDFCLPSGDDEPTFRRARRPAPLMPARDKRLARVAESLHAERFPGEGEVASEAQLQRCIVDYETTSSHVAQRAQHHMSCLRAQLPREPARDARVATLLGMHMSRITEEDGGDDVFATPHSPFAPGCDRFLEDSDCSDLESVSEVSGARARSATPDLAASPHIPARGRPKRKLEYDSPFQHSRKKVAPLLPRRMRGSASPKLASPSSSPLAIGDGRTWGGRARPMSAGTDGASLPASPGMAWTKGMSPGGSGPGYGAGGIGLRISAAPSPAPSINGDVMDEGIRMLELG